MQNYSLATISRGGKALSALVVGDQYWSLDKVNEELGLDLPASNKEILEEWAKYLPKLDKAFEWAKVQQGDRFADATVLAPILYPNKVICAGSNYHSHLTEMTGRSFTREEIGEPYFFLKPPTTTVVGPGKTVILPVDDKNFDWEVELAVVIGRGGRLIAEADVYDHIAGYTVSVDLTARGLQMVRKEPLGMNWFTSKGQDTHCPLGPVITPEHFFPRGEPIGIQLSVNGELKQDATTADLIFNIPELVSHASRFATLEPGDVILTGTPAGVGHAKGTFLKSGDKLDASVPGVGVLSLEVQ